MQVVEYSHPKPRGRPSLNCSVCGKPGYQYVRKRHSHRYVYTKHLDEPPIGFYRNGVPKFRQCYEGGRLYSSIEEAIIADNKKSKPEIKQQVIIPKIKPVLQKPRKYVRRHRVNCPRCHRRGRLDRSPISSKTPEIFRFYIDHKRVNKKIDRCYMREGEERKLAERLWSRQSL